MDEKEESGDGAKKIFKLVQIEPHEPGTCFFYADISALDRCRQINTVRLVSSCIAGDASGSPSGAAVFGIRVGWAFVRIP